MGAVFSVSRGFGGEGCGCTPPRAASGRPGGHGQRSKSRSDSPGQATAWVTRATRLVVAGGLAPKCPAQRGPLQGGYRRPGILGHSAVHFGVDRHG